MKIVDVNGVIKEAISLEHFVWTIKDSYGEDVNIPYVRVMIQGRNTKEPWIEVYKLTDFVERNPGIEI